MYPKLPNIPCPTCEKVKLHLDGFHDETAMGVTCYGCAHCYRLELKYVPENEGHGHSVIEAELKELPIIATVEFFLTKGDDDK